MQLIFHEYQITNQKHRPSKKPGLCTHVFIAIQHKLVTFTEVGELTQWFYIYHKWKKNSYNQNQH